jgi:NAD(P)-dependent dehydrogenase (short-subunit alcohol dehydrogenase family)
VSEGLALAGSKVIVTGATGGIGRAIAHRFAGDGCAVACLGRSRDALADLVSEIERRGGQAVSVTGDLLLEADIAAQIDDAVEQLDGLDIVVNNAGTDTTSWGDVHQWSAEEYDRIMAINARAPFLVAKCALPKLIDGGGGCLVHISSVSAITVWKGDVAYGMSKAALNMLSDHIAVEYADRKIRSNTIMPGVVRTKMFEASLRAGGDDAEGEIIDQHPVGRLGEPDEVAALAAQICRRELGFLTGSNILIDGALSRV